MAGRSPTLARNSRRRPLLKRGQVTICVADGDRIGTVSWSADGVARPSWRKLFAVLSPVEAVRGIVCAVDDADAELFDKHAGELTRFATGIVGPSDAPDVVSGAFLRSLVSRGWPAVTNHRAYLFRAVLNEALAMRRTAARRVRGEQTSARIEVAGQ